jgi:predicted PP-loop superfamily ATPase
MQKLKSIIIVVFVVLLCVAFAGCSTSKADAPMSIEDTTPTLVVESEETEHNFNKAVDVEKIYEEHLDVLAKAESIEIAKKEKVLELTESQMIVVDELNQLKLGNPEMVKKYFGESQKFTPEIVADRTSSADIHFIVNPESTNLLHAHICTLDYVKIVKDYVNSDDSEIAQGILNEKYNICYTLSIEVSDNGVVVTEALKEAITGGWYESELNGTKCIF